MELKIGSQVFTLGAGQEFVEMTWHPHGRFGGKFLDPNLVSRDSKENNDSIELISYVESNSS